LTEQKTPKRRCGIKNGISESFPKAYSGATHN